MNASLLVAFNPAHCRDILRDYAVCIPATGAHAIGSGYAEARGLPRTKRALDTTKCDQRCPPCGTIQHRLWW
jgi:hypothetical protein